MEIAQAAPTIRPSSGGETLAIEGRQHYPVAL
jgi:hypothetical protein